MTIKNISCSSLLAKIGSLFSCPRAKTDPSFNLSEFLNKNPVPAGKGFSTARRAWVCLTRGEVGHFNENKSAPMDKSAFSFFTKVRSICCGENGHGSTAQTLSEAFEQIIQTTPENRPANPYQVLNTALQESTEALKDSSKPREKIQELIGFLKTKISEIAPGEKAKELDQIPFEPSDTLKAASAKTASVSKKGILLAILTTVAIGTGVAVATSFSQRSIVPNGICPAPLAELNGMSAAPTPIPDALRANLQCFPNLPAYDVQLYMDPAKKWIDPEKFQSVGTLQIMNSRSKPDLLINSGIFTRQHLEMVSRPPNTPENLAFLKLAVSILALGTIYKLASWIGSSLCSRKENLEYEVLSAKAKNANPNPGNTQSSFTFFVLDQQGSGGSWGGGGGGGGAGGGSIQLPKQPTSPVATHDSPLPRSGGGGGSWGGGGSIQPGKHPSLPKQQVSTGDSPLPDVEGESNLGSTGPISSGYGLGLPQQGDSGTRPTWENLTVDLGQVDNAAKIAPPEPLSITSPSNLTGLSSPTNPVSDQTSSNSSPLRTPDELNSLLNTHRQASSSSKSVAQRTPKAQRSPFAVSFMQNKAHILENYFSVRGLPKQIWTMFSPSQSSAAHAQVSQPDPLALLSAPTQTEDLLREVTSFSSSLADQLAQAHPIATGESPNHNEESPLAVLLKNPEPAAVQTGNQGEANQNLYTLLGDVLTSQTAAGESSNNNPLRGGVLLLDPAPVETENFTGAINSFATLLADRANQAQQIATGGSSHTNPSDNEVLPALEVEEHFDDTATGHSSSLVDPLNPTSSSSVELDGVASAEAQEAPANNSNSAGIFSSLPRLPRGLLEAIRNPNLQLKRMGDRVLADKAPSKPVNNPNFTEISPARNPNALRIHVARFQQGATGSDIKQGPQVKEVSTLFSPSSSRVSPAIATHIQSLSSSPSLPRSTSSASSSSSLSFSLAGSSAMNSKSPVSDASGTQRQKKIDQLKYNIQFQQDIINRNSNGASHQTGTVNAIVKNVKRDQARQEAEKKLEQYKAELAALQNS